MGVLDRFRPPVATTWNPPSFGACVCADHVDTLLESRIPVADGAGVEDVPVTVRVAELVTSGALTVLPTPNDLYVESPTTGERRGPFHWRLLTQAGLAQFSRADAPVQLDDVLFLQPGVESALWVNESRTVLAVGAPRLCVRGLQGAVARALLNPRLRHAG
jgi:hypothetical protein